MGADAGLIVVGSRGHGALAGLLLGSVSRAVVRASTCPVAVVRAGIASHFSEFSQSEAQTPAVAVASS